MSSKTELILELEETSESLIQETLDFLRFVKYRKRQLNKLETKTNSTSDITKFLEYAESNPIFTSTPIEIPTREERNAR